ncbi:hypothetical protein [Bifidobacterium callitrichos]|uniref:Uncharacterized protein n=1 Tax=Bifidobacterium callitrichos DSM 23973 TaxID=1437609 RepID=A0A087AC42_9BIFI|nr:hypothetical protein [Bifidobacterium callitrichos]KFI56342.1 hypothetical protein BCAL_0368 [Bifidobacterium callitrichos DSM 23973]
MREDMMMAIRMDVNTALKNFEFDLKHSFDPADAQPVMRDGAPRLYDGVPAYRLEVTVNDRNTDDEVRNASVKVKHLPSAKLNKQFDIKPVGDVTVTPYVTNDNRLGWSIVFDGIAETNNNK